MWTIFNTAGLAVANCDGEPNRDLLADREEQAFFHTAEIPLPEAMLVDGEVKRKPLVRLAATVADGVAAVTAVCEESSVAALPLLIEGVAVAKPPGTFTINGEPGLKLLVDIDRRGLRGDSLEVSF